MEKIIEGIFYNLPSILIGSIVAGIIVTIIVNYLNKWKEERSKKREIFELLIKTKTIMILIILIV